MLGAWPPSVSVKFGDPDGPDRLGRLEPEAASELPVARLDALVLAADDAER